jgi:hypothetical protein
MVEPWLVVSEGTESNFCDFGWSIASHHPSFVVRFVRGKKMRTIDNLFDEACAALQFPYYFGYNWDAFSECITDLDWLPADGYVLLVQDALHVLDDDTPQFEVFLRILSDTARAWSTPVNVGEAWDRPGKPFHAILHAIPDELEALAHRLTSIGAPRGIQSVLNIADNL